MDCDKIDCDEPGHGEHHCPCYFDETICCLCGARHPNLGD